MRSGPLHASNPNAPRNAGGGGLSRRARDLRGAGVGVAVSIALHALCAVAILGTVWHASTRRAEEPTPVVLTADFERPAPSRSDARTAPSAQRPANATGEPAPAARDPDAADLAARLRALEGSAPRSGELDAISRRFGALDAGGADAPAPARAGASFAGLVAGNATKVAYVVDASGSMVGSFPAIVDEVERSLARLEPTQQFTVICFRRDGAVLLGGDGRLRNASRAARAEAVAWLRGEVVPSGRSSPVEAIAAALRSGADCVFLLSTTITGHGRHELDRESMLALLEQLNPRDPATGIRRATIQCIQFLERDPGATLEAVASAHFGAAGFRFIPRSETTLDAPPPPAPGDRP
jgi:hypothetical protein